MPQPPDEIESKFMTATKFAGEIEKLVADNNDMNYIDAIIHFCEQNSIELDTIIGDPESFPINYLER